MRRRVLTACAFAALAAGAYAATPADSSLPTSPVGASKSKRMTSVRVVDCERSDLVGRSALFSGKMRAVRHTERMWMRFSLQARVGRGKFKPLRAPGLSRWRKSKAGVRRFTYRQRVRALEEGVVYRSIVRFRWYDAEGKRLRRAKRRSRGCDQRPNLPNLRPIRIGGKKISGGKALYTVRVANYGKAGARHVPVELSIDSGPAAPLVVNSIPAGAVVAVRFKGPRCGTQVEARVDPDDAIRESRESDNSRGASCPL
jgi:hypothetical protein